MTPKTVILVYANETPCGILTVRNYDENFTSTLYDIEIDWGKSVDEYTEFVLRELKLKHYDVELNTDFEIYQTIL